MKYYRIKEVSELTSTTVRMLQFYDEIGLLKPSKRSSAGYRYYSDTDLLRLQQIIALKYIGLSLEVIKKIIYDPEIDILKLLQDQSQSLLQKADNISKASKFLTYLTTQIQAGAVINWTSLSIITTIIGENNMNENVYQHSVAGSALGVTVDYESTYNPEHLYPILREWKRREIGIMSDSPLPFYGVDCWNHYEVSWLNQKGKPCVAMAEIRYEATSPFIIESKSLKLYFNSLNNAKFSSLSHVEDTIKKDLEKALQTMVNVKIIPLDKLGQVDFHYQFEGESLDHLDITCDTYVVDPNYLSVNDEIVTETLYSDLLKSNCLVTNQPDWGSVQIIYRGKKIDREGLLRYIVSFRNHNEFHEQCIERIFVDIMEKCKPETLTVYGRYTRRGGIDINPYRSTQPVNLADKQLRLIRQ